MLRVDAAHPQWVNSKPTLRPLTTSEKDAQSCTEARGHSLQCVRRKHWKHRVRGSTSLEKKKISRSRAEGHVAARKEKKNRGAFRLARNQELRYGYPPPREKVIIKKSMNNVDSWNSYRQCVPIKHRAARSTDNTNFLFVKGKHASVYLGRLTASLETDIQTGEKRWRKVGQWLPRALKKTMVKGELNPEMKLSQSIELFVTKKLPPIRSPSDVWFSSCASWKSAATPPEFGCDTPFWRHWHNDWPGGDREKVVFRTFRKISAFSSRVVPTGFCRTILRV